VTGRGQRRPRVVAKAPEPSPAAAAAAAAAKPGAKADEGAAAGKSEKKKDAAVKPAGASAGPVVVPVLAPPSSGAAVPVLVPPPGEAKKPKKKKKSITGPSGEAAPGAGEASPAAAPVPASHAGGQPDLMDLLSGLDLSGGANAGSAPEVEPSGNPFDRLQSQLSSSSGLAGVPPVHGGAVARGVPALAPAPAPAAGPPAGDDDDPFLALATRDQKKKAPGSNPGQAASSPSKPAGPLDEFDLLASR
jgi:hypothetical protein